MSHNPTGARRLAVAPEPDRATAETARATPEPDRATLRATVRTLSDQQISNREIGRRLGISKDKVKRLLDELATEQTPGASHPEPPKSEPEPPAAAAEPPPISVERAAEPYLRLMLDAELRGNLAVLAKAGHEPHAIIRDAIALLADTYLGAWDYGICPRGIAPRVRTSASNPTQPPSGGRKD